MLLRYLSIVLICTISQALAESKTIWQIELQAPDFANNRVVENYDKYFTKVLTFKVEGIDPAEIADYYSKFFEDISWSDPLAANSNRPSIPGGWSGYNFHMGTNGEPEAIYVKSWQSDNVPATGNLRLVLSSFDGEGYSGNVTVAIMPTVDMSPLFKLNQLISADPKNIFLLYQKLNDNPFEIWKIDPNSFQAAKDDTLLQSYLEIVREVEKRYRAYGETYAP